MSFAKSKSNDGSDDEKRVSSKETGESNNQLNYSNEEDVHATKDVRIHLQGNTNDSVRETGSQ